MVKHAMSNVRMMWIWLGHMCKWWIGYTRTRMWRQAFNIVLYFDKDKVLRSNALSKKEKALSLKDDKTWKSRNL